MNLTPIILQAPIKQSLRADESKAGSNTKSTDTIDFSQLLTSITATSTEVQPTVHSPQEAMSAKLESLLASLEQLPKDELTPEHQEMLQAMMGLAAQQLQQPEEKIQDTVIAPKEVKPLEQSPIIEQAIQKELLLTLSASEKLASSLPHQAQLTDLLEEAVAVLQKLTDKAVKENEITVLPVDGKKLEQIFSQLASMVKELQTDQQKAETKTATIQVQQVEQVLKQVTGLKQEPINLVPPREIQQPVPKSSQEAFTEIQAVPKEVAAKSLETVAPAIPAEQNQSAAPGIEITKASPTPQRQEATVQQATVRLSHLVEDLGEALRGSFRLNSEGDSKQIKISIFPEHLGQMDIRLTSIDGKIVAQIFTSTLAAKDVLEQQANLLRSSMAQQGITVEKIEITQQSSQQSFGQQSAHPDQRFSQQQKQGAPSRNGYQRTEEEAVIVRHQSKDGSMMMKVDYTI